MKVTIPKPQAIVLDFLSTAIKAGFIEKGLYAYVRKHGRSIIAQKWNDSQFKELCAKVRRQTRRDRRSNEDVPAIPERTAPMEEQQEGIYNSIIWYLDNKRETSAHYKIKFAMYEVGFQNGSLKSHVYQDVERNLKRWHAMGIKIFIYSNAWVKSQKMFMEKTQHGELDSCITGYFDTSDIGEPTSVESFQKLIEKTGVPPDQMVFLTKGANEGVAARAAGIRALLVISHSHQLKRYTHEQLAEFERLRTFDDLLFEGEEPPVVPAETTTENAPAEVTETPPAPEGDSPPAEGESPPAEPAEGSAE